MQKKYRSWRALKEDKLLNRQQQENKVEKT